MAVRTTDPTFSVSSAKALDSLPRIQDVDADVVAFGHGEPWREGVSAAVERARAAFTGS
jgi:hypothetical protein